MNIVIHGLDMPRRKNDVLLVKIFPNGGLNWWNALGDSEIARTQTGRAEQLPLHGRLIDADALLREAKELSGPQTGDGWDSWGVYALIERQKTVIEAEEGE